MERDIEARAAGSGRRFQPAPPPPRGPFRFVALDVETANSSSASICQIGIACVAADNAISTWMSFVDPGGRFDRFNIAIHGIGPATVAGAPDFRSALAPILPLLQTSLVVQHSGFDRSAMRAAWAATGAGELPQFRWADSVTVARRAWPELRGNGGHGLANLGRVLGLEFRHHDGEEDARAAAEVVLRAEQHTGRPVEELILPAARKSRHAPAIALAGAAGGPLLGHVAVFTGQLGLGRAEAARLAAASGITVATTVTAATTLLIVGARDRITWHDDGPSAKHRKAEDLRAAGQEIRILDEAGFLRLLGRG